MILLLLLSVLLFGLAPAQLAAETTVTGVTVDPGGIVVWPGQAGGVCRLAGRSWSAAANGDCVFPVDLFAPAGPLTLTREQGGVTLQRTVTVNDYPYPTQVLELADDSKVNLSDEDLARVQRENAATARLWPLESTVATPRLPLGKPLDPLPLGGRFGHRRIFNGQSRNPHSGADYSVAKGTPVLAIAPGKVVLAAEHFFAGNSVFIDHGDGLISMYFHLDKIVVNEGEQVRQGQKVAEVGATGRATGPHLHFGARWRGQRINPELLFRSVQELPTIR